MHIIKDLEELKVEAKEAGRAKREREKQDKRASGLYQAGYEDGRREERIETIKRLRTIGVSAGQMLDMGYDFKELARVLFEREYREAFEEGYKEGLREACLKDDRAEDDK